MTIASIEDTALGNHFIEFMRDSGPSDQDDLQRWMSNELGSKQDRILAAFILSASGCWQDAPTHAGVAKDIIEVLESVHAIREPDIYESVLDTTINRFEEKEVEHDSRHEWIHNHRRQHLYTKGDPDDMANAVVESIESVSDPLGSSDDFGDYFISKYTTSADPFWEIYKELHSSVGGFGRLATFDFLELAYRAGQIEGLYPRVPRYDYVSSQNPQPGFNLVVFGDSDPSAAAELEEQEKDALTRLLVDKAIEQCGWDYDTAMYDVESCLCNFAKDKNKEYREGAPGASSETDFEQESC